MKLPDKPLLVAVACGGTGGHLFPGLAVAQVLEQWGCEMVLLISKKEVDQASKPLGQPTPDGASWPIQ